MHVNECNRAAPDEPRPPLARRGIFLHHQKLLGPRTMLTSPFSAPRTALSNALVEMPKFWPWTVVHVVHARVVGRP